MSTIAVIGLGIMGLPMSLNLAAAGHTVVGHTRSPGRSGSLVEAGGTLADSVAAALRDAQVIITMLPDTPDVELVARGEHGLLASAKAGSIWIDCSTIRPDIAQRLAIDAREHGIDALDAPVSGGEAGAINGTLSIMVGGDAEVVDRARPVFDVVGSSLVHVGASGAGQITKAANQMITGGTMAIVAETLVFLERNGVDTEAAFRALSGGLAGSKILEVKGPQMRRREFEPGFRVALHDKDLGIAISQARASGVYTPVMAAAAQLMAAAKARGDGQLDHTAVVQIIDALSGGTPAG